MPTRPPTDVVTGDLSSAVKRPERDTLCSPPSSSETKNELSDDICEHCSICLRGVHRHNVWITSVFFEADRAPLLEGVRGIVSDEDVNHSGLITDIRGVVVMVM